MNFRDRIQRFMIGRCGPDSLNRFLSTLSLIFLVLGLFLSRIFYWIGLALLLVCYLRMFSRNLPARYRENAWFYQKTQGIQRRINQWKVRFANRKQYKYFKCAMCGQQLRVPRGRGRISITCPKCHYEFIKKS